MFKKHIYSVLNDDHDHLFQGLQNLRKMVEEKEKKESIETVLRIIAYEFTLHFYREDELMETYHYTETRLHKYSHAMLSQIINTVILQITKDGHALTVEDIDYIDQLLTSHIANDDAHLEKFLVNVEVPKNSEELFAAMPFWHKVILWTKLQLAHFKKATKHMIVQKVIRVPVKKPANSVKQHIHDAKRNHHGWYYGNY